MLVKFSNHILGVDIIPPATHLALIGKFITMKKLQNMCNRRVLTDLFSMLSFFLLQRFSKSIWEHYLVVAYRKNSLA